jgi:hypothetical protein
MTNSESDRQSSIAREIGASYRRCTQEYAWKDLTDYMTKIVDESNHDVDVKDIEFLSVALVARSRGLREAIDKIRKHIDYALNGGVR